MTLLTKLAWISAVLLVGLCIGQAVHIWRLHGAFDKCVGRTAEYVYECRCPSVLKRVYPEVAGRLFNDGPETFDPKELGR
jgi:hypothetical protein